MTTNEDAPKSPSDNAVNSNESAKRRRSVVGARKTSPRASCVDTATSAESAPTVASAGGVGDHPWRVFEVLGVLIGIVAGTLALTAPSGVAAMPQIDGRSLQFLLTLLSVTTWVVLFLILLVTPWGRAYVAEDAGERLIADNLAGRLDSLAIAGLVFAGLAIAPSGTLPADAPAPLVAALSAFIVAWLAAFFPERMSSTLVRDAMHWVGIALLLAGVYRLTSAFVQPGEVAVILASIATVSYGAVHAAAHVRGGWA